MSLNLQKYQELAILLDQLRSNFHQTQLDFPSLRSHLIDLRQFFLQEIALFADLSSRQQSFQTEISKQLRLLEVDILFLESAKKHTTINARLKIIEERINTLIRYSNAIVHPDEKKEY